MEWISWPNDVLSGEKMMAVCSSQRRTQPEKANSSLLISHLVTPLPRAPPCRALRAETAHGKMIIFCFRRRHMKVSRIIVIFLRKCNVFFLHFASRSTRPGRNTGSDAENRYDDVPCDQRHQNNAGQVEQKAGFDHIRYGNITGTENDRIGWRCHGKHKSA